MNVRAQLAFVASICCKSASQLHNRAINVNEAKQWRYTSDSRGWVGVLVQGCGRSVEQSAWE